MYLTCNLDFPTFRRACNLMNGVDKRATCLYRGFLISPIGELQIMATDGMRLAFSDPIPVKIDDQLKEPVFINLADPSLLQGYLLQLSTASVLSIDYDEKEEKVLMMFDDYDPETFSTHNYSSGHVRPSSLIRIRDNFPKEHKLAWQLEGVTLSRIWTYIKTTKSEVRQADRIYTLQISAYRTGEAAVIADKSDCTFYTGKLSGLLADRNGQAVTYVRLSHDTLNLMYKALSSVKEPVAYSHYVRFDDADDVKHIWSCGGCHYYAMPIVTKDYKGDDTQEEYLPRTNRWYGVKRKPVSAVPTPTKTKAAETVEHSEPAEATEPTETVEPAEATEPAETVERVETENGYSIIGRGPAGPVVLARVEHHDISEPDPEPTPEPETAAYSYDYSETQEEPELESVIELNPETVTEPAAETVTEPETTEPEPDFSALVLYSDKPVYRPSPYGTKHVKNRPVQFITVNYTDWSREYIAPNTSTAEPVTAAAVAIPPIINPTRPELGDCLYKTAAFELYKNDALKRYRLIFRRHLSREERAFLFVNKWTWRREFSCYQWGITKNGADAVKKIVEFFK